MIATYKTPEPLTLAVLISGTGRTLKNFIDLVDAGELPVEIRLVISSSPTAGGLQHADAAGIPTKVCRRESHPAGFAGHKPYSEEIFSACRRADVDYVAMAGFVKYVPVPDDFEHRVLNIHPALIPSFCGKGMYGHHVHKAVLEHGVKVSGCTVHFADNQYDCGPIIDQQVVPVLDDDTPETLADRVFAAECELYPRVLRALAEGRVEVDGRQVRVMR
jgi:formyltetrahydrofolate-dependent phosphoribosylglycinamide formyltransferase